MFHAFILQYPPCIHPVEEITLGHDSRQRRSEVISFPLSLLSFSTLLSYSDVGYIEIACLKKKTYNNPHSTPLKLYLFSQRDFDMLWI